MEFSLWELPIGDVTSDEAFKMTIQIFMHMQDDDTVVSDSGGFVKNRIYRSEQ